MDFNDFQKEEEKRFDDLSIGSPMEVIKHALKVSAEEQLIETQSQRLNRYIKTFLKEHDKRLMEKIKEEIENMRLTGGLSETNAALHRNQALDDLLTKLEEYD